MKKTNYNKIAKRAVSAVTALVMLSGILPLEELPRGIKLFHFEKRIIAHAVSDTTPDISSHQQLVDYSLAYKEYEHQNDTIIIAYQTGDATTLLSGFESIGTAEKPFAGKVVINANSVCNFNLDTAFFDYVYDYVTVEVQGTGRVFTINTESDNSGAVFANHVVHDTRDSVTYDPDDSALAGDSPTKTLVTPASWSIKIADSLNAPNASPPRTSHPSDHSSLIGEMGTGTELTVCIINDSTSPFSAATGNVGTICGTMESNSKLTVASVTGSNTGNVTAAAGNAGGLVGEMKSGSELTVQSLPSTASITASQFAGGLVGKIDSATVTISGTPPSISNTVSGTSGAGGLFGYYKPVMASDAYSLTLNDFSIGTSSGRCTVKSTGGAGGFFGVLDNPGGTITLSGSSSKPIYVKGDGAKTIFGGIIGKYQATGISDTLKIQGTAAQSAQGDDPAVAASPITVNATKTGSDTTAYGGIIGKVDGAYFTSITDVDVTAASSGDLTFGGAVAIANTGYTYVKNFKLNTSNSEAHGGGVVGSCANGVVHLSGSTDISSAYFEAGNSSYGQIVGYRDSALVFADSSWNLTRNGSANTVDDIGSWGEVVRFKVSGFTIGSVLDNYYDPTDYPTTHYAKLKGASFDNSNPTKISIGSKSTFATAALNMQLNGGTNSDVLQFTGTTNSTYTVLSAKSIVLTDDVDLHHTGMTGLTRDNGSTNCQYSGSEIDADYTENGTHKQHKLTLAIGEYYEGDDSTTNTESAGKGMIYTHRYNGLFGETTSAFTAKNIIITGEVYTKDRAGDDTEYFVGTLAGNAASSFSAQNVTVDDSTKIKYATNGDKDILYVGGLVGKMAAPGTSTIGTTTYGGTTNSTFSAKISGSATNGTMYVGGVCGYVGKGGTVNVQDVKITNEVSNSGTRDTQEIGGLFGVIENGANTLNLNGIELNGLTVKGKMDSDGSMGGLLGYSWNGVTATFDHIKVLGCTLNNDSSTGNMAGLVYTGSGCWKFNSVEIGSSSGTNGITLSGSAASSLGMLVNKAYSSSKAMYLELPSGYTYKIYNVSAGTAPTLYDEIAVYTAMPDTAIEANGNSIISINTNGTTKYGTQTDTKVNMTSGSCNTYQNQVIAFNTFNPNSRYYYNLDSYKAKASLNAAENLFLYSVKKYAHSTISGNFTATTSATFADVSSSNTLDLDGYSYYPFDVASSDTINLKGTVKLHNSKIETQESASGGDSFARTTLNGTKTQHYLMHAGLFRNVNGTININGALSLGGTVPSAGDYCGAIICGTVSGSTDSDAKISSKNGSISLGGIKIWNYTAPAEGSSTLSCAPLLINKAGSYVNLEICNVSADSSNYSSEAIIASSLIGDVGTQTAREVKISFSNIKLDGRTPANSAESGLTSVYGTSWSLFRNATLLQSLSYAPSSGSYGTYNYEYSEDWGQTNGSDNRKVTYGSEISNSNSTNFQKEFWYFGEDLSSPTANYTHANSGTYQGNSVTPTPYDFSGFRHYVYVSCDKIENPSLQHQLDVNHPTGSFSGCGTYNHPFTFAATTSDSSGGLSTIAKIINNNGIANDTSIKLNLPDTLNANQWCGHTKTDCREYSFDGNSTFSCTYEDNGESVTKTWTLQQVRTYLASAYYYVSTNIVAGTDFQGLGNTGDDYAVFHGVIIGNGTIITNQSANPLIVNSYGSVVKNLTVKVENTNLSVPGANSTFEKTSGCGAYGAVIGKIFGGDNIIDQVGVQFISTTKINPTGSNVAHLPPIGGYIGVVVDGGVIFKNMNLVPAANRTGLVDSNFKTTGKIGDTKTAFLYCNPIIGRVLNGYAVTESTAYHPYEDGTRSLGDGSKEYWQSDGTIVTKTKAELDADETLDDTMKASAVGVTMKNGTKNYSIADIQSGLTTKVNNVDHKLEINNTTNTIDAYNAQDWFVLSLIINDGSGLYLGTNKVVHRGTYNDVNSVATSSNNDYANDSVGTSGIPYLLANYANSEWTNSSTGYTITMHGGTWRLPDGYRGIGGINSTNSTHNIKIANKTVNGTTSAGITGNNTVISLNMKYQSYHVLTNGTKYDNYEPGDYGYGLFNVFNPSANNTLVKDFTIKGNVKTETFNEKGVVYYNYGNAQANSEITQNANKGRLHAGMFAGLKDNTSYKVTLSNVSLQNSTVESDRRAGGFIGSAANVTLSKCPAISILIIGRGDTGGLFGYASNGSAICGDNDTDENGVSKKTTVSIDTINQNAKGTKFAFNNRTSAIGGLIGQSSGTITIENINIQKANGKDGIVRYTNIDDSDDMAAVGGFIGGLLSGNVTIRNCKLGNISIKGYSARTGGLIGNARNNPTINISNIEMDGANDSENNTIESDSKESLGGIIGFSEASLTIKDISIKNYTFSKNSSKNDMTSNYIGGCVGVLYNGKSIYLDNFSIVGCSFSGEVTNTTETTSGAGRTGGIIGCVWSGGNIYGYNVLISDVDNNLSNDKKYQGDIIGTASGTVNYKIVGFSRQDTPTDKLINNSATYTMSNTNYIIFNDYNGKCLETSPNTALPKLNGTAVTGMVDDINTKSPYVVMNPSLAVDSNNLFTGDGIDKTAVDNIAAAIDAGTNDKRYQMANTNSKGYISTFGEEFGDIIPNKSYADMPILIVNNSAEADTVVNNYIRMLTNSNSFDYSFDVNNQTYGSIGKVSGSGSTDIGTVTIKKCTYNTTNSNFDISETEPNLTISNGSFTIRTANNKEQYDTAVPNGQFTLIDIAYKDPTDNTKIAYHLYVPVLVKKLLEYHFDISVLSGSTYDISKYTSDSQRGKALVENLGTPVTFEFEYEYLRNLSEWTSEGAAYNYNKKLLFSKIGTFEFGSNTKAMLIDLNDGGKAYYLDNWTTGFSNGELDLHAFKAADGTTQFTPKTFSSLISSQNITDNTTNIKEKYYLTIFTESYNRPSNNTNEYLAHYTIQSKSFTDDTEHPSRRLDCEGQNSMQPHNMVHLIIGDFYTNELNVRTTTSNPRMYANNKQIELELSTTLSIVNTETKEQINSYLTHNDVQLFQSFLVYFEKWNNSSRGEKGISAIDHCSADISITKQDGTVLATQDRLVISRSHIELQNNTDISNALAAGSVVISASTTMEFNDDETRNLQFPQKADGSTEETGALVWGTSNLSSQRENTAYSAVSKAVEDSVGTLFYRTSDESAKLNYYADYSGTTRQNQKDSQLGVNGKEVELDTENNLSSKVYTEARYDVSQMPNADSIKYIKCEVELEQKNDPNDPESYVSVPINNYLTNLIVNGSVTTDSTSEPTKLVYILPVGVENGVETFLNEDDVYRIPIEFNVKTGNNTAFKDTESYVYANYKIKLTVSAFDHNASTDESAWTSYIDKSRPDTDFVIYTNARIYTDLIKQVS